MSEELTPRQQILLWDLVSRGGSALQMDLKPEVKPVDRKPLETKRYISVSKKVPYRLTLEEPGWNYLAVQAPNFSSSIGSKYDRPILQFVLKRIQTYARQADVGLAKILTEGHAARMIETGRETKARPDETIEKEIRAAFFAIAGLPPRDKVRLSALRARLPHIGHTELDATLLAMRKAGTANLTNLDNPRDIESEKEAALQSGLLTFHTLWIDE